MPTLMTAAPRLPSWDRKRSKVDDPVGAAELPKEPASAGDVVHVPSAAARAPYAWSALQVPIALRNATVQGRELSFLAWGWALRSNGREGAAGRLAARLGDWPRIPRPKQDL